MKKLSILLLVTTAIFAVDISMLSDEKQQLLYEKERTIKAGKNRLKYDFVGDFSLNANITESKNAGSNEARESKQASINFTQDLFRSGGISGSIRYADQWYRLALLELNSEKNGYLEELAISKLDYEMERLKLAQNSYQLANSEISLKIKELQYSAGETDITQLNDAIRERNNLEKSRLVLENTLNSKRLNLAKVTSLKPDQVVLREYKDISLDEFLRANLSLQIASISADIAKTESSLTTSNFLPTLSFNANYGIAKNEGFDQDDFYSFGLKFVMPLSVTSKTSIDEKKAQSMRKFVEFQDNKQLAKMIYDDAVSYIRSTEKSIKLLQKNIELYDRLISVTKPAVATGDRSRYDLEMLENNLKADSLEIEINRLLIRSQKARLHYMTNKEMI